jgi:hypothetical protein
VLSKQHVGVGYHVNLKSGNAFQSVPVSAVDLKHDDDQRRRLHPVGADSPVGCLRSSLVAPHFEMDGKPMTTPRPWTNRLAPQTEPLIDRSDSYHYNRQRSETRWVRCTQCRTTWRYGCPECADSFADYHRTAFDGHEVTVRDLVENLNHADRAFLKPWWFDNKVIEGEIP